MITDQLTSFIKLFEYYKFLGDQTFTQLNADQLNYQPHSESNSIVIIVKHLHGNMKSRWTECLVSDGEKPGRDRDGEFINDVLSFEQTRLLWEEGWTYLFNALKDFSTADLETVIFIRSQGHTLLEAINRQLAHYSYHVGQIVFMGKMLSGNNWQSLSIPKGKSIVYNEQKFSSSPIKRHFTDEYLDDINL